MDPTVVSLVAAGLVLGSIAFAFFLVWYGRYTRNGEIETLRQTVKRVQMLHEALLRQKRTQLAGAKDDLAAERSRVYGHASGDIDGLYKQFDRDKAGPAVEHTDPPE